MIKRLLSLVLTLSLICTMSFAETAETGTPDFKGLNDPKLLQYTEDQIYAELANALSSEDYIIENVKAIYISQEYLDELAFNSRANIFFGYTLAEIGDEFKDTGFFSLLAIMAIRLFSHLKNMMIHMIVCLEMLRLEQG